MGSHHTHGRGLSAGLAQYKPSMGSGCRKVRAEGAEVSNLLWVGLLCLRGTTRWQVSCETRTCRRWGHLIAVSAGTDPIQASTDIGINSLDAQKCGGRGMAAKSQLKRHGCGVCGSTSRASPGERKSHGSWHARHEGVQDPEAPKSSLYRHVRLSTMWMHKIMVAQAWIRILGYGGTGVYSLQPQRSRQVSCEARVLKHRRHGTEVS